jgi:hypothetical protein
MVELGGAIWQNKLSISIVLGGALLLIYGIKPLWSHFYSNFGGHVAESFNHLSELTKEHQNVLGVTKQIVNCQSDMLDMMQDLTTHAIVNNNAILQLLQEGDGLLKLKPQVGQIIGNNFSEVFTAFKNLCLKTGHIIP